MNVSKTISVIHPLSLITSQASRHGSAAGALRVTTVAMFLLPLSGAAPSYASKLKAERTGQATSSLQSSDFPRPPGPPLTPILKVRRIVHYR